MANFRCSGDDDGSDLFRRHGHGAARCRRTNRSCIRLFMRWRGVVSGGMFHEHLTMSHWEHAHSADTAHICTTTVTASAWTLTSADAATMLTSAQRLLTAMATCSLRARARRSSWLPPACLCSSLAGTDWAPAVQTACPGRIIHWHALVVLTLGTILCRLRCGQCKTNCSAYTTTTTTTTTHAPMSTTSTTTRPPDQCQMYRRVDGKECADTCLRGMVGICTRGIVVRIGSLEAGSCKDLWASATYEGTMAQQQAHVARSISTHKSRRSWSASHMPTCAGAEVARIRGYTSRCQRSATTWRCRCCHETPRQLKRSACTDAKRTSSRRTRPRAQQMQNDATAFSRHERLEVTNLGNVRAAAAAAKAVGKGICFTDAIQRSSYAYAWQQLRMTAAAACGSSCRMTAAATRDGSSYARRQHMRDGSSDA